MIVVMGVILTSVTMWTFLLRANSSTNQTQTIDQEYYFHYSMLLSRLKIDLRSAIQWTKEDETTYRFKILTRPKGGLPVEKEVTYKVTGDGNKVERTDDKGSSVFDFSSFKGGKKFEFRILP
jgi:hypothetical protein